MVAVRKDQKMPPVTGLRGARRIRRDAKNSRTICTPRTASWSAVAERERRHRFQADEARGEFHPCRACESGVALRFPPQSKTRSREGRARHSVRAGVVNQNALVGRRRRAEDCPPYQRAECAGTLPLPG
jgi:hypothetical protein